jgi:hypothetical protein
VADQQIEQVHREQRVLGGARLLGGGDPMAKLAIGQVPQRSRVGGVLVRADLGLPPFGHHQGDERGHLALDRTGIGPPHSRLELGPPLLLTGGHAALAAQLGVGEGVEELRVRPHRRVEVSLLWATSAYAHLGRLDEARDTLERLVREWHGASPSTGRAHGKGYDPVALEALLDGLRKAGMEE